MPMPTEGLKVVTRLAPARNGALKPARKYGDDLVWVRHRHDEKGLSRCTSAGLIVERTSVHSRSDRDLGIRINCAEQSLQSVARASLAAWDHAAKFRRVPRRMAASPGLPEPIAQS